VGKTGLAALTMGVAALTIEPILVQRFSGQLLWHEVVLVGTSAGVSILVFVILAGLLRIEELRWLWRLLAERMRTRSSPL
jgi:hypothetical protein